MKVQIFGRFGGCGAISRKGVRGHLKFNKRHYMVEGECWRGRSCMREAGVRSGIRSRLGTGEVGGFFQFYSARGGLK